MVAFCRGVVEGGTVYAFLAEHRRDLFQDEDFADLFPSGRGGSSIPVDAVGSVMVLQALEGLSDRDAIRALRTRIDWNVTHGLAASPRDIASSPSGPSSANEASTGPSGGRGAARPMRSAASS